jgi:hypothetical protein
MTRPRIDAAGTLSALHHAERALTLACAAWIPAVSRLETKAALATAAWQCALAADALRERVFELRYPSRLLDDAHQKRFDAAIDAPGPAAFVHTLAEGLCPELLERYRDYLRTADEQTDGPTIRILRAAILDKEEQIAALAAAAAGEGPAERAEPRPFRLAEEPARDDRYFLSSVYWPDVVDPEYPYGKGLALRVRSAVSHLNEVWAVETAGAILHALEPELGWEWARDAARWTYDEARHMLMGKRRLDAWGLDPAAVPLGGYIYEACAGEDPIVRLGMLGYFETKNIGRKRERAQAFRELGDATSETDMEFDWADETLHAELGRRWLRRLLELRGKDPESWPDVLARCEALVRARVERTTPTERERIRACADGLLDQAAERAARNLL